MLTREWIAVLATAAVYVGASILPAQGAARLTAGGWLAHAVFDYGHDRGVSSRLPQWYPALCAGFDVGVAALLCVSNTPVPSRNRRVAAESVPALGRLCAVPRTATNDVTNSNEVVTSFLLNAWPFPRLRVNQIVVTRCRGCGLCG